MEIRLSYNLTATDARTLASRPQPVVITQIPNVFLPLPPLAQPCRFHYPRLWPYNLLDFPSGHCPWCMLALFRAMATGLEGEVN